MRKNGIHGSLIIKQIHSLLAITDQIILCHVMILCIHTGGKRDDIAQFNPCQIRIAPADKDLRLCFFLYI